MVDGNTLLTSGSVEVGGTSIAVIRGIGTLYVGCPESCDASVEAEDMLAIVEASMSSEIYELMKRPDELAVVAKAHEQPRFVEDCVREMVRRVIDGYPGENVDNALRTFETMQGLEADGALDALVALLEAPGPGGAGWRRRAR